MEEPKGLGGFPASRGGKSKAAGSWQSQPLCGSSSEVGRGYVACKEFAKSPSLPPQAPP